MIGQCEHIKKDKPSPLCPECGKNAEGEKLCLDIRQLLWLHPECEVKYFERRLKEDSYLELHYCNNTMVDLNE